MALAATGCGAAADPATPASGNRPATTTPSPPLTWTIAARVVQPLDLTLPRADGRLALAADGRLFLFAPPAGVTPFARGRGGYSTRLGLEPYIALAEPVRLPGAGCSFARDDVYALQPYGRLGVVRIDRSGHATRFAALPPGGLPDAITFDQVGSFGHRLLVAEEFGTTRTAVYAFDCRGRMTTLTRTAPRLEGGITVAPRTFGAYAGRLIATNEYDGDVIDITPGGHSGVLAASHLPAGGDIGVESTGFVPAGQRSAAAYVSDRYTPHHRYAGDDAILELSPASLKAAGVRGGDLLVATEGGGLTDDIRCGATCTAREIATGPPEAYIEGHIEFAP